MKNNFLLLLMLGLLGQLRGQCPNNNTYFDTFNVPSAGSTASNQQVYANEYVLVPVLDGGEYRFSVSNAQGFTPRITLYNDANGNYINYSGSSITWNADFTGNVRFLLDNSNCSADSGYAALEVRCVTLPPPPPSNDNCSGAQTLYPNATCSGTNATTRGARNGSGGCYGDADDDVWFKFTAINTNMQIEVNGNSSFRPVINVMNSCWGSSIQCASNTSGNTLSTSLTGLTIGQIYYVQVYDYRTGQRNTSDFSICVIGTPPPSNDNCSGAQLLSLDRTCNYTSATTRGATSSGTSGCYGTADDDVWFRFTAVNTVARIKIAGASDFRPVVKVSSSCWGSSVHCESNSAGSDLTTTVTGLVVGQTYYIQVYDYRSGPENTGDFSICVIGTPPPSNDNCATAHDLFPNDGGRSGSTMGATSSGIASCVGFADDDVWYSFTANNPNMQVRIGGDEIWAGMELFAGPNCGGASLNCSASSDTWNMSGLTIGMSYKLRVYDRRSGPENTGPFWISLHGWPPPANDEWAGALTVWHEADTVPPFVFGNLQGATASNPVQNTVCGTTAPNKQDVWYKFVANSDLVKVIFRGSGEVQLQIFTDSAAAHINCVTANTNQILYGLTEGQTYYIRAVSTWGGTNGHSFSFSLGYPESPSYDDCQGAIELTQNADQTTWHWASARGTSQSFAATPNCVGTADDDIWFSFVAQSSSVAVEMISSGDYDGVMQIYSHNGCGRYHLDCINDLNGSGIESRILTNLTIGHRYKIRVYSHSSARPRSHYVGVHVLNPDAVAVQTLTQATLRVWPNPSEGIFNLDIDSDGETQVQLFDALGRQIYTTQITDNQINIQHLPAGVYVAKFMHGHKQYSTRLVKID